MLEAYGVTPDMIPRGEDVWTMILVFFVAYLLRYIFLPDDKAEDRKRR